MRVLRIGAELVGIREGGYVCVSGLGGLWGPGIGEGGAAMVCAVLR